MRESVTLTRDGVMDELAADFAGDMLDDAALFAKFSKENRTAAQKLLDSLKEFLNKVRGLFTGKYRDMAAQEAYGKDFAELEDISKQWQAAFDAAERQAEKAKTAAGEGDGARYSLKKSGIDKYYARQIDQWDGKDHGGAFRVGAVSDALLKVGVPDVDIWFDQSKAAKQLEGKSKITKDVLKQIPEVLESPVAISESYDNTVMVFGQLFDGGGNPIVVAIRISSTNRRNHISIVNKSRSVGTRSHNLDALLADDKLLYLGENKKETKKWFNALGRSTPFGGTKFGLIRSISNPVENVKPKFSLKAYWQALLLDCRVIQDPCSLIFLCREEVKQMATYAYRSISERQKIQSLWESGASVKEIAQDFDLSVSAIYTELKRGYDGTRLPDMRRRYDAELAQLTVQKSIERRGRKAAEA